MGVFSYGKSHQVVDEDLEITEEQMQDVVDELKSIMLAEDIAYGMSDDERKAFLESEEFEVLTESKKFKKKTLVRLNRQDDLTRRADQAAIVIAGQKKDRLFDLLALNRQKERKLRQLIFKKYKVQALKAAKTSQRDYIKDANKAKLMKPSDLSSTREYNT